MSGPQAYKDGVVNFYGFDFLVDRHTLIPRPETEQLVEKSFWLIQQLGINKPRIVDLGTGSGIIAITLKKLITNAVVVATDNSSAALRIARRNAERLGTAVTFKHTDLFDGLTDQFDLIIANLPYVPTGRWRYLDDSVRTFEPRSAIIAGRDGLSVLRRFCQTVKPRLNPGGIVALETDDTHKDRVRTLLASELPDHQVIDCPDLSGRHRFVFALPTPTDRGLIQSLSQSYLVAPSK